MLCLGCLYTCSIEPLVHTRAGQAALSCCQWRRQPWTCGVASCRRCWRGQWCSCRADELLSSPWRWRSFLMNTSSSFVLPLPPAGLEAAVKEWSGSETIWKIFIQHCAVGQAGCPTARGARLITTRNSNKISSNFSDVGHWFWWWIYDQNCLWVIHNSITGGYSCWVIK